MKLIAYAELKPKKGIPYTRVHLRRRVLEGTFPAPVRLGENKIAWIEDEIDEHLERLAAQRQHQPAQ